MKTALLLFRRIVAPLVGALFCSAMLGAADRRPNFLFVYTDDQRWDAMGVVQREQGDRARFPWFKTPSMDRLATEGARFRNAFVTLSLCSPSRAAFLTGRYNHLNGVIDNHTPFPEQSVTHASLLRAAGYRTGYFGKWHMGEQRGRRSGFDHSASFVGQGKYFNCPVEIDGVTTPTTGWIDDVTTAYAVEFMKQNRAHPFSMVVGFKSVHGPRGGVNLPAHLRNLYADETLRSVPNLTSRAIYHDGHPPARNPNSPAAHLDYLRHLAGADENLGKLLDALDELGLANDTVVVFTSDNGYYLGEHGLGDKRSLYEESLRIPLLVRYPRLVASGRIIDELVLNIDLAPTLLGLAGVAAPRDMQGMSWVPLLAGENRPWRQSFLAGYFFETSYVTPAMVGVRTTAAKLVTYPGRPEWTEVFDLALDPYETKNLAADPAHRDLRNRLAVELEAQMKATNYREPDGRDRPGGRR